MKNQSKNSEYMHVKCKSIIITEWNVLQELNFTSTTHLSITKIHGTIVASSSYFRTLTSPCFHDLVFLDKWFEREVTGMFLYMFVTFNKHVPFSTTSMVSSKAWSIYFHVLFVVTSLLIRGPLQFGLGVGWGGTIFSQCLLVHTRNLQINDWINI